MTLIVPILLLLAWAYNYDESVKPLIKCGDMVYTGCTTNIDLYLTALGKAR